MDTGLIQALSVALHECNKNYGAGDALTARKSKDVHYVYTKGPRPLREGIHLHRLIMNPPPGFEVDHIHHNGLDNRRSELAVVTRSVNMLNRRGNPGGKAARSKHRGVHWFKEQQKWGARVSWQSRQVFLGLYSTVEEAAQVVNAYRHSLGLPPYRNNNYEMRG